MQKLVTVFLFFSIIISATAQVGINQASPDASSILDMVSTDKGVLIPRMTAAERDGITVSAAREGLLVYVTDENVFSFYDGSAWVDLAAGSAGLVDNDGDTKVEVEQSADEDKIRFTLNGTAAGLLDKTDHNTFLGRSSGENVTATSGLRNTLYGSTSGQALTTGDDNVFVGYMAGDAINTESNNVAVGSNALKTETTNGNNTAIGYNALATSNGGAQNTALGYQAGAAVTTGDNNTFIGHGAGLTSTADADNTFVGNNAGTLANGAVQSVVMGSLAGDAITTGDDNTLIGYNAGGAINTGWRAVMIGHSAGATASDGNSDYNIYVGYSAATSNQGPGNVIIGSNAAFSSTGVTQATYSGHEAGYYNTVADGLTLFGYQAGKGQSGLSTGGENTFIGWNAGLVYTTGSANTFVGDRTGDANTSGGLNTYIGTQAGSANTTGNGGVAIGYRAHATGTAGDYVAVGYLAGEDNTSNNVTYVGAYAGNENTSGLNNVYIGFQAGEEFTTGDNNTFVGFQAGEGTSTVSTGNNNTGVGYRSLAANTTGASNVAMGYQSLDANTDGINNVVIGLDAGGAMTSDDNNVYIGYNAGEASTGASDNVYIGSEAGENATSAGGNVAIGFQAYTAVGTGIANVAIGKQSGLSATSGSYNTYLGMYTGYLTTSADSNVAIGYNALAQTQNSTTGGNNVAIGVQALNVATGKLNVAIGRGAGDNITSGDKNIVIGAEVDAVSAGGDQQLNIGDAIYGDLSNDRIGLGETTPDFPLCIEGTPVGPTYVRVGNDNATYLHAASPSISFNMYYDGTNNIYGEGSSAEYGGSIWLNEATGAISISSTAAAGNAGAVATSNNKMVLTAAGAVGIGVSAPTDQLEVGALTDQGNNLTLYTEDGLRTMTIAAADNGNNNSPFVFNSNNAFDFNIDGLNILELHSSKDFEINSTGGDMLYVDHSANRIGINETAPDGKFHITCDDGGGGGIWLESPTGHDWEIGYGVTDENLNFRSAGAYRSYVSTADGLWYAVSDGRVKDHVEPAEYGLSEIMQLEPKTYQFIHDEKNETKLGFIAQELHKIVPEIVVPGSEDLDEMPWTVNSVGLIPVLTKAIQDQQAMIEEMSKRLEELETVK